MTSGNTIVSTHLSKLFPPSQIASIPLETARQPHTVPLTSDDLDTFPEHASFASITHFPRIGPILLRVLHNGLIVELISILTNVPPIRFVFPAAVVPAPAIMAWDENELHLLAVTERGSLYRLVLPINNIALLWHDQVAENWCREYLIRNSPDQIEGVVQVQGSNSFYLGWEAWK